MQFRLTSPGGEVPSLHPRFNHRDTKAQRRRRPPTGMDAQCIGWTPCHQPVSTAAA